jgi:hypothetical protein
LAANCETIASGDPAHRIYLDDSSLLLAVGLLAEEVIEGETLPFDQKLMLALREAGNPGVPIGPPWLPEVARDISALGSTIVLGILLLAVVGYCPGRQDAIYGQPKIIMEPTGIVFLNDKDAAAITSPHSPDRFARFRKNSVASICCERHCFAFDCFGVSSTRLGISLIAISLLARHLPASCHSASEESRGSQLASRRPLGESNLSDELRLHPVHAASRQPILGKGRKRRLQPCELLAQTPQQLLVEPGPDLAGIHQLPASVVA